jgi:hypothetical protein
MQDGFRLELRATRTRYRTEFDRQARTHGPGTCSTVVRLPTGGEC